MFKALRSKNFKLFFYGQSVSVIGTWLQKTAVSWMVYSITGSVFLLGLTTFLSMIPSLFLAPLAGSIIGRYDRHKSMIFLQSMAMLQAGALALLIYLKIYNINFILALSLFQGIINAFDMTCRQTMMIDIVDHKEDLSNAVALNSTLNNFARIAGPALAGIILHTYGEDICFIGNFLSYIPVLISLLLMKITPHIKATDKLKMLEDFIEGLDYVKKETEMAKMLLMLTCSSLFVISFNTLMPVFAKDIFSGNAQTFSWFESAAGIGSIVSAIYLANLKTSKNMNKIMISASVLLGFSIIILAYSNNLTVALICMGLSGVGMMAQTSSINIYVQTKSAVNMRSRSISYYLMAYQGMIPVGSLLIGYVSNEIGTRHTVALQGMICILSVVVYVYYKNHKSTQELETCQVHYRNSNN
ncbi:MFS transporter [Flavobacterium sp. Fl-77]|uniref:MFS transporter n=1 Tax=Flavobacterium flavipigmentatum TaxID=2893884 RepID=A0AAJ2VW41_9FLAO|nr:MULTISPECIES: MFS transporter [unclassified Flavobacterium]MDX6181182.1 MFS transporter [Flavobacterium sp. Fl-33]MDX6184783.1 MFS transporter [Flavobacterium sp. Fl-77]UFH39880.1 MFS transporter [Flavobacterium sp. F-70]